MQRQEMNVFPQGLYLEHVMNCVLCSHAIMDDGWDSRSTYHFLSLSVHSRTLLMLLVMSAIVFVMMIDLLLPDSALNLPWSRRVVAHLVLLDGRAF